MAPKATAEARQTMAPRRMARCSLTEASGAIRIADVYSVASLDARPAPAAPAVRAPSARDDRRRRRCAAVHALGRLPAARGARTRDRRAPARARGPWRAPDRLGPRA